MRSGRDWGDGVKAHPQNMMKRYLESAGGALETLEFVVFICAAVVLVAVGPSIWLYRLFTSERTAWAVVIFVLWAASVVIVAREVRRKAITIISFGIFLAWLVVLVWVFRAGFA
jgi:hypothetical protein